MPIHEADVEDAPRVALLVGELLTEIMRVTGALHFRVDLSETTKRLVRFIEEGRYVVFVACDSASVVGFVALCESYALYAEALFGTIPELYVQPAYRSQHIGAELMAAAASFGRSRHWARLEVTTPPLPAFDRTLAFYERHGFAISGGRKLKLALEGEAVDRFVGELPSRRQ